MNLVKVILRPGKTHALQEVLSGLGYHGISTKESLSYGEQKHTIKQIYRGKAYEKVIDSTKRAEMEFVVPDDKVESIIRTIRNIVSTGREGDGRIYITPMNDSIHIHSGTKHLGNSSEEDLSDT